MLGEVAGMCAHLLVCQLAAPLAWRPVARREPPPTSPTSPCATFERKQIAAGHATNRKEGRETTEEEMNRTMR
jgi:hypothetical protein